MHPNLDRHAARLTARRRRQATRRALREQRRINLLGRRADRREGLVDAQRRRLLALLGYALVLLLIVSSWVVAEVWFAGVALCVAVGYHVAAVTWLARTTGGVLQRGRCTNAWRVADDRRPVQPCDCGRC